MDTDKALKILGNKIKELRLEKQLTLKDLSKLTELSEKYLQNIENGKIDYPSHILFVLANALEIDIVEIVKCLD